MIHEDYKTARRHAKLSANHFKRSWAIWKLADGKYQTDIAPKVQDENAEIIYPGPGVKKGAND